MFVATQRKSGFRRWGWGVWKDNKVGVRGCKITGHFLFTCSDTSAVGCIV